MASSRARGDAQLLADADHREALGAAGRLEPDRLLVRGGAADAQHARRFGDGQEVWEAHTYIGPIRARMSREISNYFGGPSRFPMYAAACWSVAGMAWV